MEDPFFLAFSFFLSFPSGGYFFCFLLLLCFSTSLRSVVVWDEYPGPTESVYWRVEEVI